MTGVGCFYKNITKKYLTVVSIFGIHLSMKAEIVYMYLIFVIILLIHRIQFEIQYLKISVFHFTLIRDFFSSINVQKHCKLILSYFSFFRTNKCHLILLSLLGEILYWFVLYLKERRIQKELAFYKWRMIGRYIDIQHLL